MLTLITSYNSSEIYLKVKYFLNIVTLQKPRGGVATPPPSPPPPPPPSYHGGCIRLRVRPRVKRFFLEFKEI